MSIASLAVKHPKPAGHFTYGTAGFRMKSDLLDSIMFSVGLLAVLRSKFHKGKVIGVMVTASHNADCDNGVKLVEPLGEMLEQSWEAYAITLANCETPQALESAVETIIKECNIDASSAANVVVARDTRPSGVRLVASLIDGVQALGGKLTDFGLMTTPQLHYVTRCLNTAGTPESYGEPTAQGYYQKLAKAFKAVVGGHAVLPTISVDAANGIGAIALRELLTTLGKGVIDVKITHDDTNNSKVLNANCGADYVKMHQSAPQGTTLKPLERACSLDGDADRIVFYFIDGGVFRLLDGDKIATLAASFIMAKIKEAKLTHLDKSPLHVGLVQTAYANGSSTSYVKDILQVPVVFTPTGVKHLHHEAAHFDVGVYFEANGHGTVLFSDKAVAAFKAAKGANPTEQKAIDTLVGLSDLINQTVGDALSDMLMIEAILMCTQTSFTEWDKAYTDLPSRQEKVKVANRNAFVPINADTELIEPKGLQEKIVQQVKKFQKGRCFVRPSGTEDIVRVYAEAETREETELLSQIVCGIVFDSYGGVGDRPDKFKKVGADGELL
ncbi:hypothetical protein BC833DRAFT_574975 [Globomyces pollinis-pini]|nr:hypothetical protein BC833DRAFT_574975 [Globomyces pollinis-pini]